MPSCSAKRATEPRGLEPFPGFMDKNLDIVLRRLERSRFADTADHVREVLTGNAPSRRGVPVSVQRAEGRKAPNGADYHVKIKASTGMIARDGGVVPVSAWGRGGLANFERNPVIQFAHDYRLPPVAQSVHNEMDFNEDALVQWWLFHDEDDNSRLIHTLYERGFMRAASVGFLVQDFYIPSDEEVLALQKQSGSNDEIFWIAVRAELMETSAVPVPADPAALAMQHAMRNGEAHGLNVEALSRAWQSTTEIRGTNMDEEEVVETTPQEQVRATCGCQCSACKGNCTGKMDGADAGKCGCACTACQGCKGMQKAAAEDVAHEQEEVQVQDPMVQVLERLATIEQRLGSLEQRAVTEGADAPLADPASATTEEPARSGSDLTQVEVKEGETHEQALARYVDEFLQRKLGAPVRR